MIVLRQAFGKFPQLKIWITRQTAGRLFYLSDYISLTSLKQLKKKLNFIPQTPGDSTDRLYMFSRYIQNSGINPSKLVNKQHL